jgi:hypothetical protein
MQIRSILNLIIVLLIALSCKLTTTKDLSKLDNLNSEENKTTEQFLNPELFKYKKLDKFSLEFMSYGERVKKLNKINENEIEKYFQGSTRSKDFAENNFYFFSNQGKIGDLTLITLIEEYDMCCADLCLMVYDANNKLINKNLVASVGGDGQWGYDAYGKYLNDSIYILTLVDQETIRDEADYMEYEIDSIITTYKIDSKIKLNEIDKQEYKYTRIEK